MGTSGPALLAAEEASEDVETVFNRPVESSLLGNK